MVEMTHEYGDEAAPSRVGLGKFRHVIGNKSADEKFAVVVFNR